MHTKITVIAAIGSFALGAGAAVVGAFDTQRTCIGLLDEVCDGPHVVDALISFGLALGLFALGLALLMRVRHTRRSSRTTLG